LPDEIQELITAYFDENQLLKEDKLTHFLNFIQQAENHKQLLKKLKKNYRRI